MSISIVVIPSGATASQVRRVLAHADPAAQVMTSDEAKRQARALLRRAEAGWTDD